MDKPETSFLPFHAINEYMLPDYRLQVISAVWQRLPALPKGHRSRFEQLARKYLQVTGFRNSLQAPLPLKVRTTAAAFQKHPDLVAATLEAWSEVRKDLKDRIFQLLTARKWEILPVDADRSKIPGFFTNWDPQESFDSLNAAYKEMYPAQPEAENDVSLMVVWVSLRLPFHLDDEPAAEPPA